MKKIVIWIINVGLMAIWTLSILYPEPFTPITLCIIFIYIAWLLWRICQEAETEGLLVVGMKISWVIALASGAMGGIFILAGIKTIFNTMVTVTDVLLFGIFWMLVSIAGYLHQIRDVSRNDSHFDRKQSDTHESSNHAS